MKPEVGDLYLTVYFAQFVVLLALLPVLGVWQLWTHGEQALLAAIIADVIGTPWVLMTIWGAWRYR